MRRSTSTSSATNAVVVTFGLLLLQAASVVQADVALTPDEFTATTVGMTPPGVSLKIAVRKWSDETSRAAVVAALRESDAPKALAGLPTIGYLWQNGSGVGYSVKYAYRASTPQGERITFVIDKRMGSYDVKPWAVDVPGSRPELGYSVIELYLNDRGSGDGTMSLAVSVDVDEAKALVSLAADPGAHHVLANAKLEPKPYWAGGG